jgi:hypothetical protein
MARSRASSNTFARRRFVSELFCSVMSVKVTIANMRPSGSSSCRAVSNFGQIEFESILALDSPQSYPAEQPRNVLRREQILNIPAHKFIVVPADHFSEYGIGIDHPRALICNDDALI